MNRLKRLSLNMVVMVGMTLAMSSLGLAQQETMPDQFLGADEISAQQALAQQKNKDKEKDKDKVQTANSQPQIRKHKRVANKQNASQQQTVVMARQ
jgi:hypothetical protein